MCRGGTQEETPVPERGQDEQGFPWFLRERNRFRNFHETLYLHHRGSESGERESVYSRGKPNTCG